ncbi:uncharacterized protein N7482_009689 [Penicillium canariense]|uniref:Major facilitator superfamily (MFS) profile domain-containing protein n=1 Tax=Penicillium canariense TaxID=189055 RepID=A0A9W9HRR9_9EURO|nr:uncharacterized protein N7482_009689 [Penicillium canariense]KAJ5153211.1 hypothetical protein N7482_009689 [Penicillium canariense]
MESAEVSPPSTIPENKERDTAQKQTVPRWRRFFGGSSDKEADNEVGTYRAKSTLGILSDSQTDEVPGTILLLSSNRNEPLGLRHQPQRTSTSSFHSSAPPSRASSRPAAPQKKRTADGQIVLDPQPDDSVNDPLNWPVWQRDAALFSLGFYCLMGGGMTPILAAGFTNVAETYDITKQKVAYTTGLYMLGLGIGSVIMSPTAILFGKRPVYLLGAVLFILSCVWCALSPNYPSLVIARIFQGIAVSPVECLPSATIAEIYFLHERAYRVGVYTLLLLGGKNLIPLVSAAVIGSLGWRWVFWIVAMIVGACFVLLFLFVPETFWDRTPRPRKHHKRPHMGRKVSGLVSHGFRGRHLHAQLPEQSAEPKIEAEPDVLPSPKKEKHAHFTFADTARTEEQHTETAGDNFTPTNVTTPTGDDHIVTGSSTPGIGHSDGPLQPPAPAVVPPLDPGEMEAGRHSALSPTRSESHSPGMPLPSTLQYTNRLRERPKIPFSQLLKVWNGRIAQDEWKKVAIRPFILFAYPAVLWSSVVYALSVGWLIVLSESVAVIYESSDYYGFTPLQTGLIYISPFVGGLLGTAVAGKVSDMVVRMLTRRNGGIYEPEFRLVMAIPIALSTTIGLMGFGWSAQLMEAWIVPTIFFGVISFGCCLGSTTAITFCVDSYRQYAGEALVTLNFSKNVLHGLMFSLFIVNWLESDGSRTVFLAIGGMQLACLLMTIPMYIYGKRARMWTVRKRLMERF